LSEFSPHDPVRDPGLPAGVALCSGPVLEPTEAAVTEEKRHDDGERGTSSVVSGNGDAAR